MMVEDIARELINIMSAQYSIGSNKLVCVMHDQAACNGVALRTIKFVHSSILNISHTLDLVSSKFDTPCFHGVVGESRPKAMLLWKERTGDSLTTATLRQDGGESGRS